MLINALQVGPGLRLAQFNKININNKNNKNKNRNAALSDKVSD